MYMHAQMMEVAGHNRQQVELQTVWHMVWAAANVSPPHNKFGNIVSQLIVMCPLKPVHMCVYRKRLYMYAHSITASFFIHEKAMKSMRISDIFHCSNAMKR